MTSATASKYEAAASNSFHKDVRDFIRDYQALDAEKQSISKDQRDLFVVMKSRGYNVKALRRVLAEMRRDAAELQEEKETAQLYFDAL